MESSKDQKGENVVNTTLNSKTSNYEIKDSYFSWENMNSVFSWKPSQETAYHNMIYRIDSNSICTHLR